MSEAGIENPWCSGHRKPQEDNVAGHVGDEDMAQHQVAEGIDEAGDDRHRDQERRQRTEAV